MYSRLVLFIFCLIVILFLSALFSIAETSLLSVNRFRIRYLAKKGSRTAELVKSLLGKPDRALGTLLIADNLLDIALGSITTYFITTSLRHPPTGWVYIVASALVALVIITFGKILPKTVAVANAEPLVLRVARPLRLLMLLLYPVVRVATTFSNALATLLRFNTAQSVFPQVLTEEELRSLLSEEQQHLGKEKREMLHGVFEIADIRVRAVMIARVAVTAIDINSTWERVLQTIQTSGYSRIPVYRDQFDNILGILYARDLLPLLIENKRPEPPAQELEKLLHPPHYVPDSAKIEVVLSQFQRLHLHMGIVVDEFGGVEGIVTLEDIVEEIVGEIQDEYDREPEAIKKVGPDTYVVDGNLAIRDLNRELGLGIPETLSYTTLAGFLLTLTGRLLKEGDTVQFKQLTFDIEEVEGHKVVRVLIRTKSSSLPKPDQQPKS